MQERIQKILAHGGIASRRAAEELIRAGRVRVNGKIVTELGVKANPRYDKVEVDGKRVVAEDLIYVVLHKPRGVVSTLSDPEGRPTVKELLQSIPGRVYPVGRLDFATSGVLLVTNDGELHDGLLHPRKTVPKTYVLKVKGVMTPEDLEHWRKGVRLEDGMTLPAEAKLLRHEADKTWLELTIREGRNQQIRRMGEATGFPVMRLARIAFAEVTAEGLAPGRWRHLTRDELLELKKEYGVPRNIAAPPEQAPTPARKIQARAVNVRGAVKGAAGRTQRNFGAEAVPRDRSDRSDRTGARAEGASGAENWGDNTRSARGRRPTDGPGRESSGDSRGRKPSGGDAGRSGNARGRGPSAEREGERGRKPSGGDAGRSGNARGRGPSAEREGERGRKPSGGDTGCGGNARGRGPSAEREGERGRKPSGGDTGCGGNARGRGPSAEREGERGRKPSGGDTAWGGNARGRGPSAGRDGESPGNARGRSSREDAPRAQGQGRDAGDAPGERGRGAGERGAGESHGAGAPRGDERGRGPSAGGGGGPRGRGPSAGGGGGPRGRGPSAGGGGGARGRGPSAGGGGGPRGRGPSAGGGGGPRGRGPAGGAGGTPRGAGERRGGSGRDSRGPAGPGRGPRGGR